MSTADHSQPAFVVEVRQNCFTLQRRMLLEGGTITGLDDLVSSSKGRIQITAATHDLIKDQFSCESRGPIEVKGKGTMDTWFVLGER